jgi:hypothetical protein
MSESNEKRRTAARKRFDRAMVDSTDLLAEYLDNVEFPIERHDFLLYELGRMVQEGDPSFRNEEFRSLISQGIRLNVDPDVAVRAQLVDSLRRGYPKMSPRTRRIAPEVIGAIEDADFSLDQIGAVVRTYTNQLFGKLERMTTESSHEDEARTLIASWKSGSLDRFELVEKLRTLGPGCVPPVADMLFESLNDPATVDTSLELLAVLESPLAARVLAYMVSEPILEEAHEERARAILKEFWPLPRKYILFRLKGHTHEDIPFRWIELLVETRDLRGVDRILEEVVAHARSEDYKGDLLAILGLMDRSEDPGITGKILRLMTEESAAEAPLDILEEWLETSGLAEPVEEALDRWNKGKAILVPATEDFNAFAAHQSDWGFDEIRTDWNAAYHESLGWQQRGAFARGSVEQEFERDLEEGMMRELALNPGLDEAALRDQIQSFREQRLLTPRDSVIPLVAIYLERPRDTPWLDDIYWREINGWYVRAAQYFDEGNTASARQILDIIGQIEPGYPLAQMLGGIMGEAESTD